MTRIEFAKIMAYITAGCGKPLAESSLEVYFDLLGDLPADVLLTAAKRVLMEHVWATFPSVAELREAAAQTAQGSVQPMSGGEAWQLAYAAVRKIDPEIEGSTERHTKGLPSLVVEALRDFGIPAMITADPNFARPQFIKIFDALAAREHRHALLPASVKTAVAAIGCRDEVKQMPAAVKAIADQVGISAS